MTALSLLRVAGATAAPAPALASLLPAAPTAPTASPHTEAPPTARHAPTTPPHAEAPPTAQIAPPCAHSAATLAQYAVAALLAEALLTPKPALVDRRGSGAHRDLDLARMVRSAHALYPTFFALARATHGAVPSQRLREQLGRLGRAGEQAMLAATGGSNAHRGAIWVIGLLVAGAAMSDATPAASGAAAAALACLTDRFVPARPSNGQRVARLYGTSGARGEACAGFPHVLELGLPALRASRAAGLSETHARLDALLAIMASLDDTCLLHRGGRAALDTAQAGARRVQEAGGSQSEAGMAALLQLDAALLALNASPGGAADLLAATLFLDSLAPGVAQGA